MDPTPHPPARPHALPRPVSPARRPAAPIHQSLDAGTVQSVRLSSVSQSRRTRSGEKHGGPDDEKRHIT